MSPCLSFVGAFLTFGMGTCLCETFVFFCSTHHMRAMGALDYFIYSRLEFLIFLFFVGMFVYRICVPPPPPSTAPWHSEEILRTRCYSVVHSFIRSGPILFALHFHRYLTIYSFVSPLPFVSHSLACVVGLSPFFSMFDGYKIDIGGGMAYHCV